MVRCELQSDTRSMEPLSERCRPLFAGELGGAGVLVPQLLCLAEAAQLGRQLCGLGARQKRLNDLCDRVDARCSKIRQNKKMLR